MNIDKHRFLPNCKNEYKKILLAAIIKILSVSALSFAFFACQIPAAKTNANDNVAASGAAENANVNTPIANTNTKANVSSKPIDNSPQRISFNKGANWGAVNITLASGAGQKFIVGAKRDQTMDVEVSSKETSVNLVKGKAETTEDFGFLSAELQANGDYVFEVKNSGKKEIKTSVKVTITANDMKSETTDEDSVPTDNENDKPGKTEN